MSTPYGTFASHYYNMHTIVVHIATIINFCYFSFCGYREPTRNFHCLNFGVKKF